jgi:hypothetical protein
LKDILFKEGLRSLKLAGDTRWGTIKACISECYLAEHLLYQHVNQRNWCTTGSADQKQKRTNIFNIINSTTFVSDMKIAIAILTPIDIQIKKFQSVKFLRVGRI